MKTKQKNFRLGAESRQLLADVARDLGETETAVLEFCIARYALELRVETERAKSLLLVALAKGMSGQKRER